MQPQSTVQLTAIVSTIPQVSAKSSTKSVEKNWRKAEDSKKIQSVSKLSRKHPKTTFYCITLVTESLIISRSKRSLVTKPVNNIYFFVVSPKTLLNIVKYLKNGKSSAQLSGTFLPLCVFPNDSNDLNAFWMLWMEPTNAGLSNLHTL